MKTANLSILALLFVGSGFILSSCSSAVPLSKVQESKEVKLPFEEKNYISNDFIRVIASGESADLELSENIAIQNASIKLAQSINKLVKNVSENYAKNTSDNNSSEFVKSFETQGRIITNESLSMTKVLDKKILLKPNNIYSTWVVIEISKKSLLEGATKSMSTDKKLQLEVDKIRFREIFESEMNKIDR